MANYVFLGPPGAGKGTLAGLMHARFGLVHISTGDMLRAEIQFGSALGREVSDRVASGALVPDALVARLVDARLQQPDVAPHGFILDGYPRTLPQAQLLEQALQGLGTGLEATVLIEVEREVLLARLTSRRVCGACGGVFNINFSPPATPGICDACGGALQHRPDDTMETALERLAVYAEQTAPLIDFYRGRGTLVTVDGSGTKDENVVALCGALGC